MMCLLLHSLFTSTHPPNSLNSTSVHHMQCVLNAVLTVLHSLFTRTHPPNSLTLPLSITCNVFLNAVLTVLHSVFTRTHPPNSLHCTSVHTFAMFWILSLYYLTMLQFSVDWFGQRLFWLFLGMLLGLLSLNSNFLLSNCRKAKSQNTDFQIV